MKKLLFGLIFVFQGVTVFAQGFQEIKGKVIDSQSLLPINAVKARVEGSNLSSLTNSNGIFLLKDVETGNQVVVVSYVGYSTKFFPVDVTSSLNLDLGTILLEEDRAAETQMGLITLTENDLSDDNAGSDSSASLLQATKDPFQQAAAYNWGQAFFKVRGLDNEYGKTMLNGLVMNKVNDGRPQWGNWGGLNDVTRNQVLSSGSTASDYNFGGILGTQNISTRASQIRKGARVGFSGSDANYTWRPYATYSSGLNKDGWAYAISASYRGANEARFEGTNYDALSMFASIEKKFNDHHSINFTSIYASNTRGKNSPLTQEQADLKGYKYNSYWGDQGGDKRNARYKDLNEPIMMLSHYWTFDSKNSLTTTVGYQTGHIANSRLGYQDGLNPDPTYYKKMPSYFLNKIDPQYWGMSTDEFNALPDDSQFKKDTNALLGQAQYVGDQFQTDGQIDWNWIYGVNGNYPGQRSRIVLYEDRQDEKTLSFNSNFKSLLNDNVTFDAGVNYRRVITNSYKQMVDLLGGTHYLDIDTYQSGNAAQPDLNNRNRTVGVGDKFGYDYETYADILDVFSQFRFNYKKVDFYIAQNIGYTAYERNGFYQNGIYPTNSYGKSGQVSFNNFGFKGGATVYLTGRHALNANVAYYNQAQSLRNTFANPRMNNYILPNLQNEDVFSADLSYIIRTPKLKARFSGYINEIQNSNTINYYYADGVGIVGTDGELLNSTGGAFVSEILTGVNKRNLGLELGAEYQLTQTLKATAAAALGQSFYTNNPNVQLSSDNAARVFDYGESYLKNVRTGNGPQTALSLGLEYRDPSFWWIGANVNYMAHAYTSVSAIRRTQNFVIDPDTNQPFTGLTEDKLRDVLRQEQLPSFTVVNLTGGKSWRLPNRSIIGASASLNNVLNTTYKTGGFEQARNANYGREQVNTSSGTSTFANKYFFGYGRNFFVNVYYNF